VAMCRPANHADQFLYIYYLLVLWDDLGLQVCIIDYYVYAIPIYMSI
jgi:hypothetical protein